MITTPPSRNKSHHIVIHANEKECILPPAHASSMALSISNLRLMPPTVTTAFAGRLGQSCNCPLETASRTAFSISLWAVTPNVLRNLRTLVLRISSSMTALSWVRARHSPQRAEHLWNGLAQNVFPSAFATARTYQNSRGKSNSRPGHQQPDEMPPLLSFRAAACD